MSFAHQEMVFARPDGALLAADVGGTHARIALVGASTDNRSAFSIQQYRNYPCADFPDLAAIFDAFRRDVAPGPVAAVALAIAGYVVDDAVVNVNLRWPVSIAGLRAVLDAPELAIINDFEAIAHAIGHIDASDALLLNGPDIAHTGAVLVVGPGTGLGAALRIPHRDDWVILPTESGHTTLAATTDLEADVLCELRKRGRRVEIEHVLSGTGLANLDSAIRTLHGAPLLNLTPEQISAAALAHSDPLAVETIAVFCGWFGSMLGDLALFYGAQGGIYLAGGVLPKIRDLLVHSTFAERFVDKGGMREALARIQIRLIDDEKLGVIGAASWFLSRDSNDETA
ncbi:MAG: glucokinase [Dokdonella sp.]